MNIKSLLIGSAAALAAVSGAQAADAIVAAEPEALEYVRVCDAFGTGFFYIPGTETCLKFGGYVRFQTDFGRDKSGRSDWDSFTRAQFEVDTRTDTELGALRGFIGFRGNADNASAAAVANSSNGGSAVFVDQAFIELGGLKVGKFYSWWDDGLSGEADELSSNALFNSIRYNYDAGAFTVGLSVDELENAATLFEPDNNVGVAANASFKVGGVKAALLGGYDVDNEEGAVRLIATAEIGPGTLGLAGVWASGYNAYYNESEWAVAVEYAVKATEKLTITPGFQYYGKAEAITISDRDFAGGDKWKAGVAAKYDITKGLYGMVSVNYEDTSDFVGAQANDDQVSGFVRLQRTF
ncbi:porin [Rhizobium skierniewicense]|uniref:porin n=1 Tax=Rhizobium TaxID=379 RepID=UPI001FAC427A|nr:MULTISPECIES: porin [Rhizobium]MCI9866027.1 porin [Rhizobium skierniewicense]